jgi:hypothetical protein
MFTDLGKTNLEPIHIDSNDWVDFNIYFGLDGLKIC